MISVLFATGAFAQPESVERTDVGTQYVIGRTLHIEADERAKDAISIGGDVVIEGEVTGNAIAIGGRVLSEGGGSIDGNRISLLGEGARTTLPVATPALDLFRSIYQHVVWLLVVASAAVLVSGLFPTHVRRVAEYVESRPLRTAVIGLFTSGFVMLFSALFTTLTLGLGLPISVLLMGALGVAWLLGVVALSHAIGSRIELGRTVRTQWIAVLVGIVTMGLLTFVPVLGSLVFAVASVLGVGAAVSTWFGGSLATTEVTQL